MMERGIREIDFETVDEMVQVHDYGGVSTRTDESKKAATEASKLFSDHYPECLVRPPSSSSLLSSTSSLHRRKSPDLTWSRFFSSERKVLRQRALMGDVGFLAFQADHACEDVRQAPFGWSWTSNDRERDVTTRRRAGTAEELWRRSRWVSMRWNRLISDLLGSTCFVAKKTGQLAANTPCLWQTRDKFAASANDVIFRSSTLILLRQAVFRYKFTAELLHRPLVQGT